jgi:DNA-binding IclR family transcriptional regulator
VLPLVETTSGKVMLARYSEDEVDGILRGDPHFNAMGQAQRREIKNGIAAARADGYLVTPSARTAGVSDISVPVGVAGTDTAAVLALSQLVGPMAFKADENLGAVRAAAARINRNLGVASA